MTKDPNQITEPNQIQELNVSEGIESEIEMQEDFLDNPLENERL